MDKGIIGAVPTQAGSRWVKLARASLVLLLCILFALTHFFQSTPRHVRVPARLRDVEIADHCAHLSPIGADEFLARRDALAQTLRDLNASMYVAEPGASSLFYGNISKSNWGLSERPLLLLVTPEEVDGRVRGKLSVLTPAFEAPRAKMLPLPSSDVTFVSWAEEANPYLHALAVLSDTPGSIYVDASIRTFIVDGLRAAHPDSDVHSAPYEIRRLRERKSDAELELMKCANEATVLAIRAVHKKLYFGIHESTASSMLTEAL
ncbi:unnamed protein product, partial [Mycena citricolor]